LRYIKGILNFRIKFIKGVDAQSLGYCDSDWGGCYDDMSSTSGCCFSLGSGVFTWSSKKQQSMAQSSVEVEYMTTSLTTS